LSIPHAMSVSAGIRFVFFSSRRRHTSYIGDWSSDVCSSDLKAANAFIMESDFNGDARFDVISIVKNQNETAFQHIPNAFSPSL